MVITRFVFPFIILTMFLFHGCVQTEGQRKKPTPLPEPKIHAEEDILKAVENLAEDLIATLDMKHPTYRPRIAVADLLGPGRNHTRLGRFLAEKLTTRFVKLHRFERILERHLLRDLLQQQKLEMTGYFDQDTVKEVVGKIGMEAFVTGVITDMGNNLDINARIIDHNGDILSAADMQIPKVPMANKILTANLRVLVQPSKLGIEPSEIQVSVDDATVKTSGGFALFKDVPQGNRSIMISGRGIEALQRNIYLIDDGSLSIPVNVIVFDLTVNVSPKDATVFLDGKSRTPDSNGIVVFKSLAVGKYNLMVKADCHESKSQDFEIAADDSMDIRLEKTCADITLEVKPRDAIVSFDNAPQPLSKAGIFKIPSVPFGRHSIQISAKDHETLEQDIEVKGDVNLSFILKEVKIPTPQPPGDEYNKMLTQLVAMHNDSPPFRIHLWTNKQDFRKGDNITFSFRTDRDCYLTLVDISTDGELNVIFPNCYHKDNYVRAGKTYTIPGPDYGFEFEVGGPTGIERVKAIATLTPYRMFPLDCTNSPFFSTRTSHVIGQGMGRLSGYDFADAYLQFHIRSLE